MAFNCETIKIYSQEIKRNFTTYYLNITKYYSNNTMYAVIDKHCKSHNFIELNENSHFKKQFFFLKPHLNPFQAREGLWALVSESMDRRGCAILALKVVHKNLIFA